MGYLPVEQNRRSPSMGDGAPVGDNPEYSKFIDSDKWSDESRREVRHESFTPRRKLPAAEETRR